MGDTAETGRLTEAITRLLPHLEQVWRWEEPERALSERDRWLEGLDRPLPETGVGMDQVLDELVRFVIP